MFKKIFTIYILAISLNTEAKLLDKVSGVINDKVFTLSELTRVNETLDIRTEIAPFIYKSKKLNNTEILNLLQKEFIIKDKLSELGFVISDDAVESRIIETERSLNLNREELLVFLNSKNIGFNEYFELIRQAMEYSVFQRRIIGPLVTITDQEIKNYYYKQNSNNKALSFKYKVIDFTIPSNQLITKEDIDNFPKILETYRTTGTIPSIYSEIDTLDLGDVSDEDVSQDLSIILKKTDESSFSTVYIKEGIAHSFYVKKKDLVESSDFLKKRNYIYNEIFLKKSDSIAQNWFSREILNYYILNNL